MAINYTISPKNLHAHIFQIRLVLDCANPFRDFCTLSQQKNTDKITQDRRNNWFYLSTIN